MKLDKGPDMANGRSWFYRETAIAYTRDGWKASGWISAPYWRIEALISRRGGHAVWLSVHALLVKLGTRQGYVWWTGRRHRGITLWEGAHGVHSPDWSPGVR